MNPPPANAAAVLTFWKSPGNFFARIAWRWPVAVAPVTVVARIKQVSVAAGAASVRLRVKQKL